MWEILDTVHIAMPEFPLLPKTSAGRSKGWGLRQGLRVSLLCMGGKGEPQKPFWSRTLKERFTLPSSFGKVTSALTAGFVPTHFIF